VLDSPSHSLQNAFMREQARARLAP
jgi:hypothetical protein